MTTLLTIASAGGTRSTLAADVHAVASLGALPPVTTLLTQLAAPLARAWWNANARVLLGAFQQGAAAGQCTAYAARRRPDVIARVDTWARAQAIRSGQTRLAVDWTARSWTANARGAGLTVSRAPAPNALVVFQPGAYGAGRDGHVAVVDRVGADGSLTISEMHAPQAGRITVRRFSARQARNLRHDARVSFILGPARG
jgi:surface antigen